MDCPVKGLFIFVDQMYTKEIRDPKVSERDVVIFVSSHGPVGHVSYCHHFSSVVHPSTFHILIISSETTGPVATKLWWNGPWVAPHLKIVSGDPDFQPRWPPS